MAQLGYDSYVVQGGDHGAVPAPHLGRVDAQHVRGIHVNAATIGLIPMGQVDAVTTAGLSPVEHHRLELIADFMSDGNGYNVIQATRPQTIGYGLEDSPAALLTWIAEKVQAWTHDPSKLADRHGIVRWTDVADGGHFAALEQPESLVADLRAFVRDLD